LPPSRLSRTASSRERSWRRRAIRYRYLARSDGETDDQPSSKAARAALTARPTSCSFACATSASFSSLDGETDGNHSPDFGLTNLPPMKRP
jgi:hypothetical protein